MHQYALLREFFFLSTQTKTRCSVDNVQIRGAGAKKYIYIFYFYCSLLCSQDNVNNGRNC